ncbi:MAG: DUF4149 domain-containing protein [Rhizobacter sp.]
MLAVAWLGMLLTLAFLAAPSAFAVLPREQAGQVAARLFQQEAWFSLALGVGVWLLQRRGVGAPRAGWQAENVLPGIAVLCTALGYFALQPVLASARAGQTAWSFAVWHGVSMLFFAVKTFAVSLLGWRLSNSAQRR